MGGSSKTCGLDNIVGAITAAYDPDAAANAAPETSDPVVDGDTATFVTKVPGGICVTTTWTFDSAGLVAAGDNKIAQCEAALKTSSTQLDMSHGVVGVTGFVAGVLAIRARHAML